MNFTFHFPDLGEGLEEGTILEWYVAEGQQVKEGDPLVQMETDKVVADIPSPRKGVIALLHGSVGDVIKVGAPLVEIKTDEVDGLQESGQAETIKEKVTTEPVSETEEDAGAVVGTMEVAGKDSILPESREGTPEKPSSEAPHRKALATPVARAMAREMGIDINKVPGSGPSGRVKSEDIIHFKDILQDAGTMKTAAPALPTEDVTYLPLTQIRKTIARNMLHAKHNAAHMSVFEEVEISALMGVRAKYKPKFADKGVKLTYLPFIVKAVALALRKHPQLNSQIDLENNRMIIRNRCHIGIAVDAPDGLVVPVIRDADKQSIFHIAQQIGELADKARQRKLTLDEMKEGSFSITSFGSIGGIYATPVLNYPQAGILGIGRILQTPIVRDNEIVIGHIMPLSLSVDHRIVDGGETTRFIYDVMEYLIDPLLFLMEE
ncbi:MAG: Dihydrolipoyllysine-residue acetyltransferase component of pyruvate dehydrogenase complex [Proteiniphilum acetatigenes]|uniref:Dihydrolipoamide acetyltransferase component of pyruvate dehydrogenase complex n=1 Tax=Proteiniphilum acetatigenes TaxID=294710 RepID=A0A101HIS7_9BACT|nr:MAG: Dihydrolipoyllysine-residue acetyltransferase component of pyruvate dehydrogenase complex [Proteiniphilum acetatigenes]